VLAAEEKRYHRQMILAEVGESGQERLRAARVAIVGVGGLGGPAATYLVAAGVGRLTLIDDDKVDESNLHRQVLFTEADVGKAKVCVAAARLSALNSLTRLEALERRIDRENARQTLTGCDIVLDCTDNFAARYAVNDLCAAYRIPLVQASIFQFEAQISIYCADEGPCLRCLYPEPPPPGLAPSCAEAGVLGTLPGIVGAMQANEALKYLLQAGDPLVGTLSAIDVLSNAFQLFAIPRDPTCPVCSRGHREYRPAGTSFDDIPVEVVHPSELDRLLTDGAPIQLLDVRENAERASHGPIAADTHIPLAQLQVRVRELAPSCRTVIYCASGVRSQIAARILVSAGFIAVASLEGGARGWQSYVQADRVPRVSPATGD
jgi:adenylyltransferase/sulfurtransferase